MTKILFFGHSLITHRQWSFMKHLEEATKSDVIYYPPATWGKHKFQGKGNYHVVELKNTSGGLWNYYYEPQYILDQIDKYRPQWIGGFIEPYSTAGAILIETAKKVGVKVFTFAYENVSNNFLQYPAHIKSYMRYIKKSDIIFCGNMKAQRFMNFYGAQKTVVIPHTGVDTQHWNIIDNLQGKDVQGLFIGRDVPEKGWSLIRSHIHNSQNKVFRPKYFVPDDEMPHLMNRAKYFVHASLRTPSWEEQLGYVIAEALACGLPVMISKYGSQVEWFGDAPNVIIYDPLEKGSTLNAIKIMRQKKGTNLEGREWIENNFSNKVVAQKWAKYLE